MKPRGLYGRLRARSVAPLARYFPIDGLIVDLGCGVGALTVALLEGAPRRRVIAVDHDASRVDALRKRAAGAPVEVVCAAMQTYALPACAGVALVDVLHYIGADAQDALLASAADALEPGGVVVLRDPDAALGARFLWNRVHERIATGLGLTRARIGHYRRADAWATTLAGLGLEAHVEPVVPGVYADRVIVGRKL